MFVYDLIEIDVGNILLVGKISILSFNGFKVYYSFNSITKYYMDVNIFRLSGYTVFI